MRPAEEILAALRDWDCEEACAKVAHEHGVSLEQVCSPDRHRNVVAARHAIWVFQLEEHHQSYSAIARFWGVDHTSVMYAETRANRGVTRVVLNQYPPPPDAPQWTFEWCKRQGNQFGVFDVVNERAMWFASYLLARAAFVACCEESGAPTCRKIALGEVAVPPVLEEDGGPGMAREQSGVIEKGGA